MSIRFLFLLVLPLLLIGCAPDKSISTQAETADTRFQGAFTLYRLDGDRYPGDPVPQGAVLLHGWPILQTCSIGSMATRKELFRAFDDGIAKSSGEPIDCFNPRHAIRVETDGVNVDYVICFQCHNYEIWEGDKKVSGGSTSPSPRATFDRILDDCKKTQ
jgi:hypothetical protein